MNKFGGDAVNTTLPFKPAEVHTSWIWACFLVIITPTIHQFSFHLKQKCLKGEKNGKEIEVNDFYIYRNILSPDRVVPEPSNPNPNPDTTGRSGNTFTTKDDSNGENNSKVNKPSTSTGHSSDNSGENHPSTSGSPTAQVFDKPDIASCQMVIVSIRIFNLLYEVSQMQK